MFGKKKKQHAVEVTKLSSLIADNLHIVGDIHFTGGLRVDGRIEGNVLGKRGEKSLIVLSEKGCIVGRVHAFDAIINGTVSGDLEVEHFLELQPGAKVSGNITYRQLQMECGATVEGNLVRVEAKAAGSAKALETPSPKPAVPDPRSVQSALRGPSAEGDEAKQIPRVASLGLRDERGGGASAPTPAAPPAPTSPSAQTSRAVSPKHATLNRDSPASS